MQKMAVSHNELFNFLTHAKCCCIRCWMVVGDVNSEQDDQELQTKPDFANKLQTGDSAQSCHAAGIVNCPEGCESVGVVES